jgi:hypothetical protein
MPGKWQEYTFKIAVPHHLVEVSGKAYGLDAYFWNHVEVEARKALMIRPASALTSDIMGCTVLPVKVEFREQLEDLKSLSAGLLKWTARHARWKLTRLLAPAPEPRGGWEYVYASRIAGSLRLENARLTGISWLVVSITFRGKDVASNDKIYNWLLENDRMFAVRAREILKLME